MYVLIKNSNYLHSRDHTSQGINNLMQQRLSNCICPTANQEVPCLLRDPKVHYCVHCSLSWARWI